MQKPTPGSRLSGLSKSAIHSVVATAQALDAGHVPEAESLIVPALSLAPNHPEVLRLLAGIQALRGHHAQAVQSMRAAIAGRPDDALYHNTLVTNLIEQNDLDGAIETLRRATQLDPEFGVAFYNLGLAYMHSARPADAAIALRRCVELIPRHGSARTLLADILRAGGQTDEAVAEFRKILADSPTSGVAWWGLANLKTVPLRDADLEAMRKARGSAADSDRIGIGFALGKALADRGEYQQALTSISEANTIAQRRRRWSAEGFSDAVTQSMSAFVSPPRDLDPQLGREAIFIVSMPRSGSTLLEQILASHSQVQGTSELPDLPLVLTEESQRRNTPFPQWVTQASPDDWARLGRRYLERTAARRDGGKPFFTDKLLNNWFYLGAIRRMLPGAHVIVARRDPLETCLSCYFQQFANNEFTRSFADLAAYWRDFDRAIGHWKRAHPDYIYENVYEELVTDPERTIRALLAFCELEFEPACLDFHATRRDVLTASSAQVREPLRADTARAARFGALLDPLRAELNLPPFSGAPA